jgi:hypothetical protein
LWTISEFVGMNRTTCCQEQTKEGASNLGG